MSNGYSHTKPPMYTEKRQDGSLRLFFNSLQEEQAGTYTCKGNYANTMQLSKSVTIDTIREYNTQRLKELWQISMKLFHDIYVRYDNIEQNNKI